MIVMDEVIKYAHGVMEMDTKIVYHVAEPATKNVSVVVELEQRDVLRVMGTDMIHGETNVHGAGGEVTKNVGVVMVGG